VSASNLGQRIDPGRMETELGRLAQTINDTFDRLQAAFEQQVRFTTDASHELRTPLSVVASQAELALRASGSPRSTETPCRPSWRRHDACGRSSMTC